MSQDHATPGRHGYRVKVYDGYGDRDSLIVHGHVFRSGYAHQKGDRKGFFRNALQLVRLFLLEPVPYAQVELQWLDMRVEAETDADGHFQIDMKPAHEPAPGWHDIVVELKRGGSSGPAIKGSGRIFSPHPNQFAIVSDIDDTFLVSHSARTWKRLKLILTRGASHREPFRDVVAHYQALSMGTGVQKDPTPFFYVSSSEWNLYDYLHDFLGTHGFPEGILLLSPLKRITNFWRTGQGKHGLKFIRIARIIASFPHHKYILLGDDTQQDPFIYEQVAEHHPERVHAVYIRKVKPSAQQQVEQVLAKLRAMGIHCCYFTESRDALHHSRSIGIASGGPVS